MRYFNRSQLVVLGLMALPLVAKADGLNVSLVNRAVSGLIRTVLAERAAQPQPPIVTALELRLHEGDTDLSQADRFRARLIASATVNRTAWLQNGNTSVELDVAASVNEPKREIGLNVGGTLRTDVPALYRFLGKDMETSYCNPRRATSPGFTPELASKACDEAKRVGSVTDIGTLLRHLDGLNDIELEVLARRKSELEVRLETAEPRIRPSIESTLRSVRKDTIVHTRLAEELKRAICTPGSDSAVRVHVTNFDAQDFGQLDELELYLSKDRVEVKVKWVQRDVQNIATYLAMRPQIETYLLAIQNGDAEATAEIKELAKFLLTATERWLNQSN